MSGDCCRAVATVLMTPEERTAIEQVIGFGWAKTLHWSPDETGRFVRLKAHPCPFLQADNKCGVYEVRPYNCRRWGCFRACAAKEPLEPDHSFLGAANTRDRWDQSRGVRRQLIQMQRKAQRWAWAHGWTEDTEPPV